MLFGMTVECMRFIEENKRLLEERNKAIEKTLDGTKILWIRVFDASEEAKAYYNHLRFCVNFLGKAFNKMKPSLLPSEEDGFTCNDFYTLTGLLCDKNMLARDSCEVQPEVVCEEQRMLFDCMLERGFAIKYAFWELIQELSAASNKAFIKFASGFSSLQLEDGRKLSDVMPPVCEETMDEWKKMMLHRLTFDKVGHPYIHLDNGDVLRVGLMMILASKQFVDETNEILDGAKDRFVKCV